MKAVILNDTSNVPHVGCILGMDNIRRECRRAGIEIVASFPFDVSDLPERMQGLEDRFETILINGEGTMHHDRPKAIKLAEVVKIKRQLGKKIVLFNTVWFGNRLLNRMLPFVDKIYCRESLSQKEIVRGGGCAKVVPDMVFSTPVPPRLKGNSKTVKSLMMDSCLSKTTKRLAWIAIWKKCQFLALYPRSVKQLAKSVSISLGFRLLGIHPTHLSDPKAVMNQIATSRIIFSGRFHGICLALLLEKPVIAFSSNTPKIEGIYHDIGLDPNQVYKPRPLGLNRFSIEEHITYFNEQRLRIRSYVQKAPSTISDMFQEIKNISHEN